MTPLSHVIADARARRLNPAWRAVLLPSRVEKRYRISSYCRCTCTPCANDNHGCCNFRCDDARWRARCNITKQRKRHDHGAGDTWEQALAEARKRLQC